MWRFPPSLARSPSSKRTVTDPRAACDCGVGRIVRGEGASTSDFDAFVSTTSRGDWATSDGSREYPRLYATTFPVFGGGGDFASHAPLPSRRRPEPRRLQRSAGVERTRLRGARSSPSRAVRRGRGLLGMKRFHEQVKWVRGMLGPRASIVPRAHRDEHGRGYRAAHGKFVSAGRSVPRAFLDCEGPPHPSPRNFDVIACEPKSTI